VVTNRKARSLGRFILHHGFQIRRQPPGSRKPVFDKIEQLSGFPESGRIVPELADPYIREIIIRPCRISIVVHTANTEPSKSREYGMR